MEALIFYKGQPIEVLSRDELLDAFRELSRVIPSAATGLIQMTKHEAVNLGLITPAEA